MIKLLSNELIKALTVDERYSVIGDLPFTPDADPLKRYSEIKSRANYSKLTEKCEAKGWTSQHLAVAFYDLSDESVNEKLLSFIEKQEWFVYYQNSAKYYFENKNVTVYNSARNYDVSNSIHFLIAYAKETLSRHILKLNNITCTDLTIERIVAQISNSCLPIYAKTVIYEYYLNIDSYSGKTKLSDFIKENFFSEERAFEFYKKYPVLLRRVCTKIYNEVNYYIGMFSDLDTEHKHLVDSGFVTGAAITDISCSAGDTHEKGASVTMLTYNDCKIVYKPRNLYITKTFENFVNAINSDFDLLKLPIIKTVWRERYTIEERIAYKECESESGIKHFYERIGYYLAILYLFNGNDIHYENIIACGEHPYLIDLETLFSHCLEQYKQTGSVYEKAVRVINHSVRGTHMLPSFISDKNKKEKADISGLGGQHAKLPNQQLALIDWGTDDIKYTMQDVYLQDTNNIPSFDNQRVQYEKYETEIIDGFTKFMDVVLDNKKWFAGKIAGFAGVKTRQVLRSTSDYGYMLQFASHPNYTQDMVYFERFLESVWNLPYNNPSVNCCEEAELLCDDIPVFYCSADGVDLISGSGTTIRDFYMQDGLSAMKQRIEKLDSSEIKKQTAQILCAFGQADSFKKEEFDKLVETNRFRNSLCNSHSAAPHNHIINVLNREAISESTTNDVTWCTIDSSGEVVYLPVDFAGGSAGILAYLLELPAGNDSDGLAEKTVNAFLSQKDTGLFKTSISGTKGWASTLLPICKYLDRNYSEDVALVTDAVATWCESKLAEPLDQEQLNGISPAIIALVSVYEETLNYKYLKLADTCVSKILQLGSFYLCTVFNPWQIQQLCFALELYYKHSPNPSITDMINAVSAGQHGESDNTATLNSVKYKLLRKNNLDSLNCVTFEDMYNAINNCRPENASTILNLIDILILARKCNIANDDRQRSLIEKKLSDLFALVSYEAKQFDALALGLGLDSLLCGIGLRWEYAYNDNKSTYYRLF